MGRKRRRGCEVTETGRVADSVGGTREPEGDQTAPPRFARLPVAGWAPGHMAVTFSMETPPAVRVFDEIKAQCPLSFRGLEVKKGSIASVWGLFQVTLI